MKPKYIVLNLMIPDFPHNIGIRFFVALLWESQQGGDRSTSGCNNKKFNRADLILALLGKYGITKFEFQNI